MIFFSQLAALVLMNLRGIPKRWGSALSAVFGIAGVVMVLVGVLSIAQGFRRTLASSGREDTALVMRSGSDTEMMSGLSREESRLVADAPGIQRTDSGTLVSPELYVIINLPKRGTGSDANVPLRGVARSARDIRDDFQLLEGRYFEWGRNEVVVGLGAAMEFEGLQVGDTIQVGPARWQVVGLFSSGGGIAESEIWCDAGVLQGAYRRGETFQSVRARLESPEDFQMFKDALDADPRLNVKVVRETEYYQEQSELLYNLVTGLGYFIAVLMSVGAAFGALNTMYNAVVSRAREIATLRAIGFKGMPVIISILLEAMVLAAIGGLIGAIAAHALFDDFRAATLNFASFSQVTFAFEVDNTLLISGLGWALLIGLVGGLFPAIHIVRQPLANALREM